MGFFGKLGRFVMDAVEIPIDVVKDVATLGGAIEENDESYTSKKLKDLGKDWEDMKDSLD